MLVEWEMSVRGSNVFEFFLLAFHNSGIHWFIHSFIFLILFIFRRLWRGVKVLLFCFVCIKSSIILMVHLHFWQFGIYKSFIFLHLLSLWKDDAIAVGVAAVVDTAKWFVWLLASSFFLSAWSHFLYSSYFKLFLVGLFIYNLFLNSFKICLTVLLFSCRTIWRYLWHRCIKL